VEKVEHQENNRNYLKCKDFKNRNYNSF